MARKWVTPLALPALPALLALLALVVAPGCAEPPRPGDLTGEVVQQNDPVPAGPHLYCITNIGHTMVALSLGEPAVLTETRRWLELDPAGPWFVGGAGYYISRVDSSGAGANALIAFDPQTLAETGRLNFPPNSNPSALLPLDGGGSAYVALRGSTFDNFATNGIAVVSLPDLVQTGYLDLNDQANQVAGQTLTSLVGFFSDDACGLGFSCIYAVADNWRNAVRQGWLLVLEPRGTGPPLIRDTVALGLNPRGTLLLDGQRELWVVNNGGFAGFDGLPGTVQVLDTATFADGTAGNETVALLQIGGDPTGIYPFGPTRGWVTTYPDDAVRTVDLDGDTLQPPDAALPTVTGPLIATTAPGPRLFAGRNGFAAAMLAELDPATGALLAEHDLQSGNGPVSCAEYTLP